MLCVTASADEVCSGSSIETVHRARLVDERQQSSCTVSIVKLDWQSVDDSDLTALADNIDSIIATGITSSNSTCCVVFLSVGCTVHRI